MVLSVCSPGAITCNRKLDTAVGGVDDGVGVGPAAHAPELVVGAKSTSSLAENETDTSSEAVGGRKIKSGVEASSVASSGLPAINDLDGSFVFEGGSVVVVIRGGTSGRVGE